MFFSGTVTADVVVIKTPYTDSCDTPAATCPNGYVVTGAWFSGGIPASCVGTDRPYAISVTPPTNPTTVRSSSGSLIVSASCAKVCN